MDFERFQEFMLHSAARHDSEMAVIRESLGSITKTVGRLVDNQVYLQESMDILTRKVVEEADAWEKRHAAFEKQNAEAHAEIQQALSELDRILFGHTTDPDAHKLN